MADRRGPDPLRCTPDAVTPDAVTPDAVTLGDADRDGLALRRELQRKALHLSSAAAPVAYAAGLPRHLLLVALSTLLLGAIVVELARHHLPSVRRLFHRATGALLRPHERAGWSGATWLLVAFTGVVALAPAGAAIVAMWSVSVGDAAAALVGRSFSAWRARRYGHAGAAAGKTLAGSLACLVASASGAMCLTAAGSGVALVAGLAAAGAEWPPGPLDDNVRVAGVVAVVVVLTGIIVGPGR